MVFLVNVVVVEYGIDIEVCLSLEGLNLGDVRDGGFVVEDGELQCVCSIYVWVDFML